MSSHIPLRDSRAISNVTRRPRRTLTDPDTGGDDDSHVDSNDCVSLKNKSKHNVQGDYGNNTDSSLSSSVLKSNEIEENRYFNTHTASAAGSYVGENLFWPCNLRPYNVSSGSRGCKQHRASMPKSTPYNNGHIGLIYTSKGNFKGIKPDFGVDCKSDRIGLKRHLYRSETKHGKKPKGVDKDEGEKEDKQKRKHKTKDSSEGSITSKEDTSEKKVDSSLQLSSVEGGVQWEDVQSKKKDKKTKKDKHDNVKQVENTTNTDDGKMTEHSKKQHKKEYKNGKKLTIPDLLEEYQEFPEDTTRKGTPAKKDEEQKDEDHEDEDDTKKKEKKHHKSKHDKSEKKGDVPGKGNQAERDEDQQDEEHDDEDDTKKKEKKHHKSKHGKSEKNRDSSGEGTPVHRDEDQQDEEHDDEDDTKRKEKKHHKSKHDKSEEKEKLINAHAHARDMAEYTGEKHEERRQSDKKHEEFHDVVEEYKRKESEEKQKHPSEITSIEKLSSEQTFPTTEDDAGKPYEEKPGIRATNDENLTFLIKSLSEEYMEKTTYKSYHDLNDATVIPTASTKEIKHDLPYSGGLGNDVEKQNVGDLDIQEETYLDPHITNRYIEGSKSSPNTKSNQSPKWNIFTPLKMSGQSFHSVDSFYDPLHLENSGTYIDSRELPQKNGSVPIVGGGWFGSKSGEVSAYETPDEHLDEFRSKRKVSEEVAAENHQLRRRSRSFGKVTVNCLMAFFIVYIVLRFIRFLNFIIGEIVVFEEVGKKFKEKEKFGASWWN